MEFLEIKCWGKWDEVAHDFYAKELKEYGITGKDMEIAKGDMEYTQKLAGTKDVYYKSIIDQSDLEKEAVNFDRAFALYNGTIKVGLTERVNVLERETVRLFMKKINFYQRFDVPKEDSDGEPVSNKADSMMDIMA